MVLLTAVNFLWTEHSFFFFFFFPPEILSLGVCISWFMSLSRFS